MSDTEDEPFDKEAEKEKLRQQLAEEEQAREATQHMSELLLKGATMTNRHCDECGDPIFRHDGREFCPTCGRQAASGTESAGEGATAEEGSHATGDGGTATATQPTPEAGPEAQPPGPAGGQQPQGGATQFSGAADLPAAREALARKVTALAQEAEATSDVGRARELLAAVREGAEALRALESRSR